MKFIFILFLSAAILLTFNNCKNNSSSPSSCMENPDSNSKFLVIVGEKINIKEEEPLFDSATWLGYSKFKAHYKILEKVCGDYKEDTITFTVFDHYGFPEFGKYQHVLLYLNVTKNEIFHARYLYSDLYKTKDGRWASPYSVFDYDGLDESEKGSIKPERIDFAEEVSYSIEGYTRARTNNLFPEPYYRIDKVRKKAIAIWGNYIPKLFQLQKETTLEARGVFGKPDSIIPRELKLEESEQLSLSKKDSIALLTTWSSFIKAIRTNDPLLIKNISLDSIICSVCEGMPRPDYENNLESIDMFIDSANINFQKADLWSTIDKNKFKIYVTKYPERKPKEIPLKEGEDLKVYAIHFRKSLKFNDQKYGQYHSFEFVKIDDRFRLYKMESN